MQNTKRASLLALLSAVTLSLGFAQPWSDTALKETDHKKLGKEVAAYWRATDEKKDIQKTFEKLSTAIDKTQKKVKDQDVLALTEDWEAIFRFASLDGMKDKVKKGKVTTTDMDGAFGEVSVTYCAPKKYASKKGVVPIILVVAADDADPAEHLDAEWADVALREEAVIAVVQMEGVEEWDGQSGVYAVMSTFTAIKGSFAVDFDRILLAGSGKGFAAAGATASAYPQLFAGLIGLGEVPVVAAANFRSIPTFLTAESDGGKALTEQIEALGFGNCTVNKEASQADVWTWAKSQAREPYPAQISFSPRFSSAQAAHWLQVGGVNYEAQPHIEATVDRAANTITIDADKISTVAIYFNDALVDLSGPVTIILNGNAQEESVTRNRRTMIDLAYNQGDWGRVFTSFSSFDVPSKTGSEE
jgi:hypothetical protein